jgi:hypothetical protein
MLNARRSQRTALHRNGTGSVAFTKLSSTVKTSVAALLAQFNPAFAPSPSSRCLMSELKVSWGK